VTLFNGVQKILPFFIGYIWEIIGKGVCFIF